jgi:hypothetical protein
MTDVYAASGTFSDKHQLAHELAGAVMRWEAGPEIPLFANNAGAFIHGLPGEAISTVAGRSDYVRVQVLTPAGVLDRDKQLGVVAELTEIIARGRRLGHRATDMGVADRVAGRRLGHRRTRQHTGRHRRGGRRGPLPRPLDMERPDRSVLLTPDGRIPW